MRLKRGTKYCLSVISVLISSIVVIGIILYNLHKNEIPPHKYSIPFFAFIFLKYDDFTIRNQINKNNTTSNLYVKLSEIYLFESDFANYNKNINRAAELYPDIFIEYKTIGYDKYKNQQYEEAIWYYKLSRDLDIGGKEVFDTSLIVALTYKDLAESAIDSDEKYKYYKLAEDECKRTIRLLEQNKNLPVNSKKILKNVLEEELRYLNKKIGTK